MSTPSVSRITFRPFVSAEDQARADIYALLSRLFADGPDEALLAAIAGAPPLPTEDVGAPLARAWSDLIAVASAADAQAMREEYDELFIGIGKAPLNLHASFHLTGFMMEKPLVNVRSDLAAMGFARLDSSPHVEDHLASLLETMRVLIVGTVDINAKSISEQRVFFEKHIGPWFARCLDQILKSPLANLYKPVAQLAKEFLILEQEQFALA